MQELLRTSMMGVIGCNCDRRVCVLEPGAGTHRKLAATTLHSHALGGQQGLMADVLAAVVADDVYVCVANS